MLQTQDLDAIATAGWLHRRAGVGRGADTAVAADAHDALISLLTRSPDQGDPWNGVEFDVQGGGRADAVRAWFTRLLQATDPYLERRTLFLHCWLVTSMGVVPPRPMVDQLRLYRSIGGGSFPDLLRAATIDAGMLIYLDGRTSTAAAPNENYGRELLELFSLGTGTSDNGSDQPYTEDDVLAAARALTGWVVRRNLPAPRLVPARHDDAPQTLLGTTGVHDVDTVVDAIVSHPEHARFVARRVAADYVGDVTDPRLDGVVDELAATYTSSGRRLDEVIGAALRLAVDGVSTPIVLAPVPWMVSTARVLDLEARTVLSGSRDTVRSMGQVPMYPPSVAGWPGGTDWLTTSAITARVNVAHRLAEAAADDNDLVVAADDGDTDRLAALIGVREPFGPGTIDAIRNARDPRASLTLALVCPEALMS